MTEFPIDRLASDDVSDNVALARAVGWTDAESDWRVLHDGAVVLGIRHAGRLIGQGALGLYGSAGTVAKMIVAPDFQRQRIGGSLLDALLQEAQRRSIGVLGLVATPFGRPLYERKQFAPVGEVVVLVGTPELTNPVIPAARLDATAPLDDADVAPVVDERWMSCLRANMLRSRFREAIATSCTRGPDGHPTGYAMATAQGSLTMVGPVIAETEEGACTMCCALFRSLATPVRIDVPAEQRDFREWLYRVGFREQGVRVEMAMGATQLPWQVRQRYALASQAWG